MHSTKGVGQTAPDPSEAQAVEDGIVVPLGKPKEQLSSKVQHTTIKKMNYKFSVEQ